ncbi:hypothetical protein [Streptomyces griseosporeus]|uniref:hypothetical protein n=1 Tax=Streptomyces griseosporeus TaxID=1910 RepID=UPI0036F727B9
MDLSGEGETSHTLSRAEKAMETLSRFGELAWFKLPTEQNPQYGYRQVTYMGWRYLSPREGLDEFIEGAVREVPTQLDWTFDRSGRNWMLLPSRILEEAQGFSQPGFSDTLHSINLNEPDFCISSLSDFDLIIQHLRNISPPAT